jgi:hypothetical protein
VKKNSLLCALRFANKSANKRGKLPRVASPLSTPPHHSWFAAAGAAKTTGLDTGRSAQPACGRPATADPSGNGLLFPYFIIWNGALAPFVKIWNETLAPFQNLARNIGSFQYLQRNISFKIWKEFRSFHNLGRNIASLHDLEQIMSTHSCHSNKKLIILCSPAKYWTGHVSVSAGKRFS